MFQIGLCSSNMPCLSARPCCHLKAQIIPQTPFMNTVNLVALALMGTLVWRSPFQAWAVWSLSSYSDVVLSKRYTSVILCPRVSWNKWRRCITEWYRGSEERGSSKQSTLGNEDFTSQWRTLFLCIQMMTGYSFVNPSSFTDLSFGLPNTSIRSLALSNFHLYDCCPSTLFFFFFTISTRIYFYGVTIQTKSWEIVKVQFMLMHLL